MTPTSTRGLSVLGDPAFPIQIARKSTIDSSLPEVLARLLTADDPISSFPGLAAEQVSHWYRFLVRCATRALRHHDLNDEIQRQSVQALSEVLRDRLSEAAGGEGAWLLYQPDPRRPAFMQAPIPGSGAHGTLEGSGYKVDSVASLTSLLGSKNFERKSDAVRALTAAELVYALLELQGGAIYGGRGNYQTQLTPSRSGQGSGVPFMGIMLPEGIGATFQRDVRLFREAEDRIREELRVDGDEWALWTLPWDGERSIPSTALDPAFLPLARLVRVAAPDEEETFSTVWLRSSATSRVEDLSGGALLGDPFTPTIPDPKQEGSRKVRGVMKHGFVYPEVAELLGFADRGVRPSDTVAAFFEERGSERRSGVKVVFEGVAFEQGKTLGFHRKVLPLPTGRTGGSMFIRPEPFREAHARMLGVLDEAKAILRASARIVVSGAPKPRKGDESVARLPTERLDRFVDSGDAYLTKLFRFGKREQEGDQDWERDWREWVCEQARRAFVDVLPMLVAPTSQRIRREADALNHLDARLWRLGGESPPSTEPADTYD